MVTPRVRGRTLGPCEAPPSPVPEEPFIEHFFCSLVVQMAKNLPAMQETWV